MVLPFPYRLRLRAALLSLPNVSFSVVDLVLQDFTHGPSSLYLDQPPRIWFEEKLSRLGDTTMMYSALIDLAYRQSRTCVQILALLSCALEPLRPADFCALWEFSFDQDDDTVLSPERLYGIVAKGEMPTMVTADGDGLHLSNDLARQAIHRQMKGAQPIPHEMSERKLSHVFEDYEMFHCRIARSCLRLLHQKKTLSGRSYAEKHWANHLRQAGGSAVELNALVKEYYQQHRSAPASPVQEPHDAKQSKLFRRLAEDHLSVNLGSIFGSDAGSVVYPDPSDIDAALNADVPDKDTLVILRKINSRSPYQGHEKQQRHRKLEIVIAIQGHNIRGLEEMMKEEEFFMNEKMSFLQLAIDTPNVEAANVILQQFRRHSLAPLDHPSRELLMRAVRYQNKALVQSLLRYKHLFDLDAALIAAVEASNVALCQNLLSYGANVLVKSKTGETVLHLAAKTNSPDLVMLLLRWNAAVDDADAKSRTPLHLAAECGYTDVAQVLLKNSASLTTRDLSGKSPFFAACAEGRRDVAQLLSFSGADLRERDASGRTVLHAAAREGHEEIVEMLLHAGMSVEPSDKYGITPLHEAAERGWALIVKKLLDSGATVEKKCTGGASALHFACTSINVPEAVVQLLLRCGADIRARDVLGRTPMLLAAHLSTVRVVKLLAQRNQQLLRDRDDRKRGVCDYVNAADPLDSMVLSDSVAHKPTFEQRLARSKRKANRREKQEFLREVLLDMDLRLEEDDWESISILQMAEAEPAELQQGRGQ